MNLVEVTGHISIFRFFLVKETGKINEQSHFDTVISVHAKTFISFACLTFSLNLNNMYYYSQMKLFYKIKLHNSRDFSKYFSFYNTMRAKQKVKSLRNGRIAHILRALVVANEIPNNDTLKSHVVFE